MRGSIVLVLFLAACGESKIYYVNEAPVVTIQSPVDGEAVNEGDTTTFTGTVKDDSTNPGDLGITWQSDVDGILSQDTSADANGITTFATASLSVANHVITLKATDAEGQEGLYTIAVTVNDVPDNPTLTVVHPIAGEYGVEGTDFNFVVQVADEQDSPEELEISFTSDQLGDEPFCTPTADAVGVASCTYDLPGGDHLLTFAVTDTSGLVVTAQYYFAVTPTTEIDDDEDGWSESQGDCNDDSPAINPSATELYNNIDDDCDGTIDEGTQNFDDDLDGQRELDGDCDDGDPYTYLGAPESCDGRDNDCDTIVDETTVCYDDDGDGYTELYNDCDDNYALTYPSAPEIEDGQDNDCDGTTDEGTGAYDDDFDGYTENDGDCDDSSATVSPVATESCDGWDNDCDGNADEEGASGCFTYYYDYDGDSYGSASVAGNCYCAPTGYFTSAYNNDCYDYNSSANPAQTTYNITHRGDTSYDWNCDGAETQYYTDVGECSGFLCDTFGEESSGWESGVPACGVTDDWITSCYIDWFECNANTTLVTQSCL